MINSDIKISVITPIYNVEKYIYFFLETVVNQTLKDIEIICVIDGSKDNSKAITEEFAQKDNRIKIIEQENQGPAVAKNTGLKAAIGEFVAFLDPDDMLPARTTLEKLYNSAKAENVKICGGSLLELRKGFVERSHWKPCIFLKNHIIKYADYQFCYLYQRFIFKRNFLIENDLFFPVLTRYEDPFWMAKTMHLAEDFFALRDFTYIYRVSNNTATTDKIKLIDSIKGFKLIIDYAYQNKLWKLFTFQWSIFNDNYWQEILENGYKLYPDEIAISIKDLLPSFDYSVFEKSGMAFKLNDFLSQFEESKY